MNGEGVGQTKTKIAKKVQSLNENDGWWNVSANVLSGQWYDDVENSNAHVR